MDVCFTAGCHNTRASDDLSGRWGHAPEGDWAAALRGQNRQQAIAMPTTLITIKIADGYYLLSIPTYIFTVVENVCVN